MENKLRLQGFFQNIEKISKGIENLPQDSFSVKNWNATKRRVIKSCQSISRRVEIFAENCLSVEPFSLEINRVCEEASFNFNKMRSFEALMLLGFLEKFKFQLMVFLVEKKLIPVSKGDLEETKGHVYAQINRCIKKHSVPVLYDGQGMIVIDKPAGLVTQGGGHWGKELWQIMKKYNGYGLAHRIDKDTTGVVILGHSQMCGYLHDVWHTATSKVYLAVIQTPKWEAKIVSEPLDGKSACTSLEVLESRKGFSLVRCGLIRNGRNHQIRKHLKFLGSPIVGDGKYKGQETDLRRGQLLHAWRLRLRMPIQEGWKWQPGPWKTFQAAIPEDFKSFGFNFEKLDAGGMVPIKII